jgi:diketogulonate reductase-like aldo/keto reductase
MADLTGPGDELTLRGGVRIPRLGLGVFRAAAGRETAQAVQAALVAGYRHIDTARIYGNETDVGAAIRASGIDPEQVFVTTKLWNDDHGYPVLVTGWDPTSPL